MNQDVHQKANTIINGDKVYIFLASDENEKLLIKSESMWGEMLGISYHQFSYKKDIISTIGREDEIQKIKDFLAGDESFKVNAITGRAGNGKSRLVYYTFKDEDIKQEWFVYGLNYDEVRYYDYQYIRYLIGKKLINKKILFVIDYVAINADQIGEWIKKLYNNSKVDKGEVRIRILLVERTHVTEDRKPYWYMRLVEGNKLDVLGLCNYSNHIQLHNLQDDQLRNIFVEYVKKNKVKYKEIYGTELDDDICRKEADKIIKNLEKECKTPLYIMYIADAWINDNSKNGRNWNRKESLEYIVRKENDRIKGFFLNNKSKEAALKRILIYSIVLNGVKLGNSCPAFLHKDFELLRTEFGADNPNLRHLFNDVGKIESGNEVTFKSVFPEIVGEFYCLDYLANISTNSFDDAYVRKFVECAWEENPSAFASFLCRLIEDFSDHNLVTFSRILEMPVFLEAQNKVLYADVLREYAFWNKKILNYFQRICTGFTDILYEEKNKMVCTAIREKYAIALFNMAWWCKQAISSEETDCCIEMIFKKMEEICGGESNEIICQACRAVKWMSESKLGIKD